MTLIGAPCNDVTETNSGRVLLFGFDVQGSHLVQQGSNIDDETNVDRSLFSRFCLFNLLTLYLF